MADKGEVLFTVKYESGSGYPGDWKISLKVVGKDAFLVANGCDAEGKTRYKFAVPMMWAREIEKELKGMMIPIAPRSVEMGCDGEFIELTIGDEWGGAKYRWWSVPMGWEPLGLFADKIKQLFDELREGSNPKFDSMRSFEILVPAEGED